MKVLLVTSQVTYVPSNYRELFKELLGSAGEHLAGLVILKNLSPKLLGDVAGLTYLGCTGVASTMARNIAELPLRRRERLFESRKLPVLYALSMNQRRMISWVRDNGIDLVVNLRPRCIYKKHILAAPTLGCLNIHHGLLPECRGTLCDLYALWNKKPAGFTIHQMNEKIDAGKILVRREVSRPGEKDYIAYLARTGLEEGRALAELIREVAATGKLPEGTPNICSSPVYTRNPTREQIRRMRRDGMIL